MNSKPQGTFAWQRLTAARLTWPRSRVARSFFIAVPWINAVFLFVWIAIYLTHTLLQPGKIVDLPEAPFEEGLLASIPSAVIQYVAVPNQSTYSVLIFEDSRYDSFNHQSTERIKTALKQTPALNLLVDAAIPYGDLAKWITILKHAGVSQINLVEKQP